MNFNDVSAFLDLVKDPAKYNKYIAEMKVEQDRLTYLIEQKAKLDSVDGFVQSAEKAMNVAKAKADKLLADTEKAIEKRQAVYDDMMEKATKKQQAADTSLSLVNEKLANAEKALSETKAREAGLAKAEAAITSRTESLTTLIAEYEEKVAKLRSVMS